MWTFFRNWNIMKRGALVIATLCVAATTQAQLLAGKTNLLLWGNLTPNVSLELVTSERTSVNGGIFYSLDSNPMDCSIKGADVQLRYWLSGRPMARSFVALGLQGMRYHAVFSGKEHHGDAAGPGIVYGYAFPLGKRFNLELSAGVSVMWYREAKYAKGTEMPKEYNVTGRKVMPMGLGISCSYIFK